MQITEFQLKALQIIYDTPGISAQVFAIRLWPDSHYPKKTQRGALMGGSYAGRLVRRGWVNRRFSVVGKKIWRDGYELADEGIAILAAAKRQS